MTFVIFFVVKLQTFWLSHLHVAYLFNVTGKDAVSFLRNLVPVTSVMAFPNLAVRVWFNCNANLATHLSSLVVHENVVMIHLF